MATESIARFLGDSAELRPLAERLQYIKRLNKRYRTLVPESLAEASRVCAIDGATVVVSAASGTVATALRHLAPRLLEGLRSARKTSKSSRDQELTSLRVEIQVAAPPVRRTVVARSPMPKEKLAGVARSLSEGPLKETLERLSGDQNIRKTRSKT